MNTLEVMELVDTVDAPDTVDVLEGVVELGSKTVQHLVPKTNIDVISYQKELLRQT